jgi:hypothetical protein
MVARFVAAALALLLGSAGSLAQQQSSPVPLYPGAAPHSIAPEPLPPLAPAPETAGPPDATPPAGLPAPAEAAASGAPSMSAPLSAPLSEPTGRVFCEQPVTVQLADPDAVAQRYQPFVGMWSDASWTPQLCAALIVEKIAPDGTATILYVFGPMGSNTRAPGGVLHGTGSIRDGELRFQNSDGSQFAFRLVYADLDGSLTTPQGQSYRAIFKKTP